ncbi:hypothetical protein AT00_12400 [Pseudoalteromonas lipolytica SCSIO 04301]|uniref:hypothetical protein n=1 Tax=Pseudoalteromonas lipolytica TaxID=570156 RepID=UPI00044DAAF9|nr:hypothetical protein [Pseudoalteromonas lipolytica]EWH05736.1 hypothetical protein AT00_12400 [Pseudoalteromonas lipolytica SCSIO 04301]
MKLLVFLVFVSFNSLANQLVRDSDFEHSETIYWVNKDNNNAIIYSQFEAFHMLKGLISKTLMSEPFGVNVSEDICHFDRLLFVDEQKNLLFEIAINDDEIIYKGNAYNVKNKSLEKFKSHNLKRIENNESMLGRYIKLNVNDYSDKCTNF